ncbi:hypothetical protein AB9F29_18515 [Falsihalocynthiibacter sp. S25ZX9]|uniref:hypothetical protein n=1 Tax=Falsihalocynthiibacter sp. S25ZX9 TaxID=3240870 RepID=UPI00350FCCFF
MKTVIAITLAIFAGSTAASAADVQAASPGAITVKHSMANSNKATEIALQHCAQHGRAAVLVSKTRVNFSFKTMSSYSCQ